MIVVAEIVEIAIWPSLDILDLLFGLPAMRIAIVCPATATSETESDDGRSDQ
jgi:hypothetical protein